MNNDGMSYFENLQKEWAKRRAAILRDLRTMKNGAVAKKHGVSPARITAIRKKGK